MNEQLKNILSKILECSNNNWIQTRKLDAILREEVGEQASSYRDLLVSNDYLDYIGEDDWEVKFKDVD